MKGIVENVEEEGKNEGSPANSHYSLDCGGIDLMRNITGVSHDHFLVVNCKDQGQATIKSEKFLTSTEYLGLTSSED